MKYLLGDVLDDLARGLTPQPPSETNFVYYECIENFSIESIKSQASLSGELIEEKYTIEKGTE